MIVFSRFVAFIAFVLISTNQASAFNFGFVRVPDWMDSYILGLLAIAGVSWAGLLISKPQGVPTNQLSQVRLSPLANFFRIAALISVLLLIGFLFVGMGLRRLSE
ncbi:MAG: hypothetical protein JJ902_11670 [Roseibium sp.]|nr:hypothetical protein [Roseibium sp.]